MAGEKVPLRPGGGRQNFASVELQNSFIQKTSAPQPRQNFAARFLLKRTSLTGGGAAVVKFRAPLSGEGAPQRARAERLSLRKKIFSEFLSDFFQVLLFNQVLFFQVVFFFQVLFF